MFTRKQKIVFGFFIPFVISILGSSLLSTLVSAITPADIARATYRMTSQSNIQMTIARPPNDGNDVYNFAQDNDNELRFVYARNPIVAEEMCVATIVLSGPIPPSQTDVTVRATLQYFIANSGDDNLFDCIDDTLRITGTLGVNVVVPAVVNGGGSTDDDPGGAATNTGEDECKRGSITSFEWWACPLLEGLDSIAQNLTDIIEGLLFFDTSSAGDESYEGVYKAWNLFRYIASVILVIVMFVMVISQAISMGPFDAYTVRKILPKLLAGAIAIQLSWPFCIFIINIFNNLGAGVAELMMFPFGGADALTLDDSLGAAMGGTSTIQGVGILTVLIIGGVLAALNIFLLLAVFVGIVFSLFLGFVVLVVRKMLIIVLIMTAPVALALWILPGTKKYWDLWQNTFIGLLMMFPLIMALIASGRILAHIVAEGGGFGGASLGIQALNAILVLVVFFAPFWLIPKTFSWGGRAFANMAGVVNNRSKGLVDRPQKFLGERQTQRREFRRAESAARLHDNNYAGGVGGRSRRFIDRAMTGHLDPTRRYAGANEMRKHELETAKLGFEQSEAANTRDLEIAKLEAARRLAPQAHVARLAAVDATETKQLQEFADSQVSAIPTDTAGISQLRDLSMTGTREQAIAANAKLLESKRYTAIDEFNIQNSPYYDETFTVKPSLFGSVAGDRADLLPPNKSASIDTVVGNKSLADMPSAHATFIQRTAFGKTSPTGPMRDETQARALTPAAFTADLQAGHDALLAQMQGMAETDASSRSMLGGDKEKAFNFVLEKAQSRGVTVVDPKTGATVAIPNNVRDYIATVRPR